MTLTKKRKLSLKKRNRVVVKHKRTIKKGNRKTVKKMTGGGAFEDESYTVLDEREEVLINNVSGINISTPAENDYTMMGKSTTLLHNIYLQNMIENIINDVNCSNKLTLFVKSLKSMPEKTNYLSKDSDEFLHYYIYNELISKYEGDDIMDCMIVTTDDETKEYDTNYSVSKYKFLFNYNLCDLYVNYAFEQLINAVTEYNLTNSTSQINEFNDTIKSLYNRPTYYNIYDVNDLKKVINLLGDNSINSKLITYFYSVDYKNSKLDDLAIYLTQITGYDFKDDRMTKVIFDKSQTILTFVNKIQGIIEQSRVFKPTPQISTPSPNTSPQTPTTTEQSQEKLSTTKQSQEKLSTTTKQSQENLPTLLSNQDIITFFSEFNENSETQPETPMSRAIMYLITISNKVTIASEISKFEPLLNIKLEDTAKSTLIDLIQQYQQNIYGSATNSVYFYNPVVVKNGGGKSAPTSTTMNSMKTELAKKHIVYDNAHDFDYGIYEGYSPLCKDLCDYSIVARSDAIKTYRDNYGTSIVGTDSTIKSHIWNLTFDKFIPYLATVKFKFDSKNQPEAVKAMQKYICKEILQVDNINELHKSTVSFHHDMGGMFTELMVKSKLSLSTDADNAKDVASKNSKTFIDLHNSTLLKAWDSSTGGFNIGNKTIKDYITSSDPSKALNALIAYNLQSLTAMVKYFAIDYYDEVVKLFNNNSSKTYIPVLQATSLKKTEFVVELYLINIDTAKEIYEFIRKTHDEYKASTSSAFIKKINAEKLLDIEGRLNVAYKKSGTISKIYRLNTIYYPQKKYSVNSILKALNLPINTKRSGNPNKESIKSLVDLLNVDVLKMNLTGINRNKYLFMLKHSGDTCQGIQTGLAFDVLNLALKDSGKSFTNSILYTEDALAFCNAVFNGNSVMTITAKNNEVCIHHTRKTLTLESFAASVKKIYDHLSQATTKTSPTYKAEVAYFNKILNTINKKSKNELSSDEVIELIKRISEYNDYFNLKMVFEQLKTVNDKSVTSGLYGGIIDFGKYESYFDFNSIYLLTAPKDLTGTDLTTNKLRFNKFINTYKNFNQITVERVDSVYKTKDSSGKNNNLIELTAKMSKPRTDYSTDDAMFYSRFYIMIDDVVKNSGSAWVENIFKNFLTSFNSDLIELLVHIKDLKEQYNKVDKLKALVSSKDKIHSLLNISAKQIQSTADFNSIMNDVFASRLNLYKKELKNEMNYEGTRKANSKVEFVSTEKAVKYNLNLNVFKLNAFEH